MSRYESISQQTRSGGGRAPSYSQQQQYRDGYPASGGGAPEPPRGARRSQHPSYSDSQNHYHPPPARNARRSSSGAYRSSNAYAAAGAGGSAAAARPRSSSYAAVGGSPNMVSEKAGRGGRGGGGGGGGKKKWVILGIVLLVVAAAVAVPVGVVYGNKASKNNNLAASGAGLQGQGISSSSSTSSSSSSTPSSSTSPPSTSSSTLSSTSSTRTLTSTPSSGGSSSSSIDYSARPSSLHSSSTSAPGSSASPSSSTSAAVAVPTNLGTKTKWDWSKNKMVGVNLGNFLILERWMSEDWFVATAGANAWDEWSFCTSLGASAASALQDHWNTWITESDIQTLFTAGINSVRIPTGFWMWIPTISGEPYVTTGQKDQLNRVLGYLWARNMYAIIDLHGLPGSQNGEQQSGHNTTNPTFYQPLNQARADATVAAVVEFIASSPYASIIMAIEAANEPRPYTTEQFSMLRAYYERSYATIQTLGSKAPAMMFADGFVSGDKLAYWYDFAAARVTSPPSLLFTDHPYPGYFPAQNNSANILQQTCTDAARYQNFPVPTVITEWSLRTGIQNSDFEQQYYIQQLTAWSWFGGSAFWSIRALDSEVAVLADPVAQYQWSFESLLQRGSIPTPSNANESTNAFLSGLGTPCGTAPSLNTGAPTGTGAPAASASAAAANALTASIDSAALAAAQTFGYGGIGASATPTAGSRMARVRKHLNI